MVEASTDHVEFATALTIAWLGNQHNRVNADDVPAFLNSMYQTVSQLSGGTAAQQGDVSEVAAYEPKVSVRKSLASKDHIISMIDGKPYKALRRHLSTNGLTPDDYRQRYGLKPDYPMVAENYSESRRAMAKKIGLGRKPGETVASRTSPKLASKSAARGSRKTDEKARRD